MLVRRIARPLLGSIFIYSGYQVLRSPGYAAQAAEPVVGTVTGLLPDSPLVPASATTWVRINAGVHLGAGTLLAVGKFPRVSSAVLGASLVPTTLAGHAFWNETDPQTRNLQKIQFFKNTSLLGGLIIAAADTEGKPGLAWHTKHAASTATAAVAGALPGLKSSQVSAGEKAAEVASAAGEKVADVAGVAGERVAAASSELADKTQSLAAKAAARGADLAATARDNAPVVAEEAKVTGTKLAERLATRGGEIRSNAKDLASEAASRGADLATEARGRGAELAADAASRGADLAAEARLRAAAAESAKKPSWLERFRR